MNTLAITVRQSDGDLATVATGDDLWSHAGERGKATVTPWGALLVDVYEGASNVHVTKIGYGGWGPALPCNYCTNTATHEDRWGDIYCRICARLHYKREETKLITAETIQRVYGAAYNC